MKMAFSKIFDNSVEEIGKLPGIGKRTALRLALHINKMDERNVQTLVNAISDLKSKVKQCKCCYNLSDDDICEMCANPKRDRKVICVVQDIRDVIAIEATQQFNGLYHVLGGIISPMDGIGPDQLKLAELFHRVENEEVEEVVLALPATVEGDTTNFYIYKNICAKISKITTIARGVGIGEELEFIDEVTLGRSLLARTDFNLIYSKRK
ncbi:MAG: recombination mediator RecR [Bacteroidales bacterium]|nr:recombination mediator RecR [Bacteroidales bacterium]